MSSGTCEHNRKPINSNLGINPIFEISRRKLKSKIIRILEEFNFNKKRYIRASKNIL